MARSSLEIVRDINRFDPLGGVWDELGALVEELTNSAEPSLGVEALLGIFERGAGIESGGGVFSDVLHALEQMPGYEPRLMKSLARRPAVFSVRMVDRLLRSGVSQIAGASLIACLVECANAPTTVRIVRDEIRRVLANHDPAMLNRLKEQ